MMDCLKPKPEPKRRVPACEDADAISSRIAEIARSEGREPHRMNPAEMKPAPAETGDLYGIGACFLHQRSPFMDMIAQLDRADQIGASRAAIDLLSAAERLAQAAICGEHEDGA